MLTNTEMHLLRFAQSTITFKHAARSIGAEFAGPSKRGSFLLLDKSGKCWLFGPFKSALYGREYLNSAWSELNVSRMEELR